MQKFDAIIIGTGQAGPPLAARLSAAGMKVAVIERKAFGGTWALGDCNGKGAFTHTSYNDFEIVAANLLDHDPRRVSDRIPAYALYTDPPLGRVGMTEREVRQRNKPALIAKRPMTRVGRRSKREKPKAS